jgi:hypothetical protein
MMELRVVAFMVAAFFVLGIICVASLKGEGAKNVERSIYQKIG